LTVIFPKWTNRIPAIVGASVVLLGTLIVFAVWYWFSPKNLEVGYAPEQPIHYSHRLHAGVLGMDCRYCHQTVDHADYAAIPSSGTCMNCHKTVLADRPDIKKLREAHESGRAVEWINVHMLPQYAYFPHAAHVRAGVGCASCHGRIDQMDVVRQVAPLSMGWCLECHRNPEAHLRPPAEVFNMGYEPNPSEGARLKQEAAINPPIHCSACHR
jgi:hypothetical protein